MLRRLVLNLNYPRGLQCNGRLRGTAEIGMRGIQDSEFSLFVATLSLLGNNRAGAATFRSDNKRRLRSQ